MTTTVLQSTDSGQATFGTTPTDATKLTASKAANVPAMSTGTLVLLSDVLTALTALRTSHNDLLAKMKAAGLMDPD